MKSLKLCITCDSDPDQATMNHRGDLTWRGIAELPRAIGVLNNLKLKLTLFVRIDLQIRTVFKNPLGLLEKNQKLMSLISEGGHEWGWHPHLFNKEGSPLYEAKEACAQLQEICREIKKAGLQPSAVRLGESWHSNETMKCLDDLGFCVDSTAIPGRLRSDDLRVFDWSVTPNHPYHPSQKDFRKPGANELKILEVPMSTALIKTSYDKAPLYRYLALNYRADIFSNAVNSFLDSKSGEVLVIILHPGELLSAPKNDLYEFGFAPFERNLNELLRILKEREIQYTPTCISEVADA